MRRVEDRGIVASIPLTLTPETAVDEATSRAIEAGLDAYNDSIAPCDNQSPLWIVGRDSIGAVQAGIHGVTLFDWLFVRWLWVAERHRRRGVGSNYCWAPKQSPESGVVPPAISTHSASRLRDSTNGTAIGNLAGSMASRRAMREFGFRRRFRKKNGREIFLDLW
jgi:hypothetical protein